MGIIQVMLGVFQQDGDLEKADRLRKTLEGILQGEEKCVLVDDFDVEPGCPPGENFAAEVTRVVVYGRRWCLNVWTDIRKSFIVKRVPEPDSPYHSFYDCRGMFENEVVVYEHLIPMCYNYLDKKTRKEQTQLPFPKFYGRCQYFLLLQDLQTEGYQVVNRVKGFSAKECSLILRELSKFHAMSFALKNDERSTFMKNVERLKESVFREEYIQKTTGEFWENSVKFAIRSLKESKEPKFEKVWMTLSSYSGKILKTLINIIKSEFGRFDVINHGDLWNNNIMLRYCESGYPIGVKFIDLQASRYTSCVLDVMHVLFTSSRPVIHEKHLQILLSEYYRSLVANLMLLDAIPTFTFDEFMVELKKKILFGVFVSCLMFTCITRTATTTKSSTSKTSQNFETLDDTYRSLSSGYHIRLRTLFLALINFQLI